MNVKRAEGWHGAVNCLTIDFDIIMGPSINLYNDLVSDDWTLSKIEKTYPNLPLVLPPDYFMYDYITRFLIKLFKVLPKEKVFFVSHHRSAGTLLDGQTNVALTNIDHHHDVGYENVRAITRLAAPHDGDWVKYLKDKNVLESYTWIGNSNSFYPKDELEHYIDASMEVKQVDLFASVPQVDMLIICNSPEWIPEQYQTLWDIWTGIYEEWYGVEFDMI